MEKAVENKYAFEARTFHCQSCEAEIEKGHSYYSAIQMTEEAFIRSENCVSCWEKVEHPEDSVFAFWKTLRPAPPEGPIRKRKFDIELVWSFFLNLNEDLSQPDDDLVDESLLEEEVLIEEESNDGEEAEVDSEDELEAMGVTFEEGDQELELDEGENPDDWEEFEFEIDDEDLEDDDDEDDEEDDIDDEEEYETVDDDEVRSEELNSEEQSTENEEPKILTRKDKSKLLFLLTLLLMRGKRLDLAKSIYKEGKEFLSLTVKGDCEDVYLVEDPQLSHEDLEEVKDSLGDLLQMQL